MTEIWHIVPTNDIKEHTDGMKCSCNPVMKKIGEEQYSIVHHSFDGREAIEMAMEIINGDEGE